MLRMRLTRLSSWFFLCSILQIQSAVADPLTRKPYLMASFGDSLTTGFIAQTSAIPKDPKEQTEKLKNPKSWTAPKAVTDTLDDRATRHRKSDFVYEVAQFENHKSLSWSSGSEIQSHYQRLKGYLKKKDPQSDLVAKNFAVTGARSVDLLKQVAELKKAWESGKYQSIPYVTVLIGANDACDVEYVGGTPNSQMLKELNMFFSQLAAIAAMTSHVEPIRVFISSLPNIPSLAKPQFFSFRPGRAACREIQMDDLKFCTPLLNWKTPNQYWERLDVVQQKNNVLKAAVDQATKSYPQLKIALGTQFFEAKFDLKYLAADCFHPNQAGQEGLAELFWNEQPWFK